MNSKDPIVILEAAAQKKATNAGVGQDKYPPERIGAALVEFQSAATTPESAAVSQAAPAPPADTRPKHHGSETRQTAQIAGRAPFATKAKIAAIAKTNGLSESQVVVSLVHKALQMEADVEYGAMLRPVISSQIHKDMGSLSSRNATIGLQAYYAAEQARILAIHILRFLTDLVESSDELPLLIKVAQEEAWKHMTNLNRDKAVTKAPDETTTEEEKWPS